VLPGRWFAQIAIIWTGQAVSMLTSFAAAFAAIWYITETTGSAFMLSVSAICAYLPFGLLSPFGGVIADKFNRKTTMMVADLAVGVVSLGLGVIIMLGQVSIGLLLFLITVRSIGQAFHSPAMMAAMPMLVPERHLLRINTLDQLVMSLSNIAGPAFGILLYTTLGFHWVMFLDFAGALVAVAGLAFARIPTTIDKSMEDQHVFANLADGWRALAVSRGLVVLIVGMVLGQMIIAPMGALFPLMTMDHFNGDGYMASIIEAAFGTGMLIGSVILVVWGGGKRLAGLICAAALVAGVATAACGLLPPSRFVGFVALTGILAAVLAAFNSPLITLIQRYVPEAKMGRSLGLTTAAFGLAGPLGIVALGALAEAIGITWFFVVDGVACALLAAGVYAFRSVRALDQAPVPIAQDGTEATASPTA